MSGRGRLAGGVKTGFLDVKKRNIYVSLNGRYYANGPSGRVYAPKARFTSANGSVRALHARNNVPASIRPARLQMAPSNAKARRAERAYVRARAIVPYAPNFVPLSPANVLAAQTLTAMRANKGKSRFSALANLAALESHPSSAWGNSPGNSPVYNAVAARRKTRAKTAAVLNNVALRGLFGGKVYRGKYKTNEERKAAARASAARYRAKKRAEKGL